MRLLTPFQNFSRANLDHDLMGRFDLPIYTSGTDIFRNGISNFKGNCIYRTGFESMLVFQDCVFAEFKFNNQQQYIIVMYANKFRFISYDVSGNFGWVLDSGGVNPLEVSTPYSLDDCRLLDYTQKNDTMIFTRKGYAPRKLTRLSANSFSFSTYARVNDPFINLEATQVITAITQANPAVVTIAGHGYVTGDKAFITGVVGMEQVNDLVFDVTRIDANNFSIGVNSTSYDAYVSDGTSQKLKSTAITNITQANPAVVTSSSHTLSTGDIVTIYGVVGMTQVNGGTFTVDKINNNSFSLRGINSTGYTAYSSGGRVRELEDYPAKCRYYKGRLYFANTSLRITTIFASKSGDYDNFTMTPVDDASALQFTIADISQEIEWMFGGDNSLIVGAGDGIVAVNGGTVGSPITAGTVASKPTSAPPCNGAFPLSKDGLIFYVGLEGRNIYYFQYDLLTESFIAEDANFVSFDITKSGMKKIRWKKDRNDLITAIANDGRLLTNNFNAKEKIIGWHDHDTYGEFLDEAVITDQEGKPQLFALVKRDDVYYIERQAAYVEFCKRSDFREDYDFDASREEIGQTKMFDDDAYKFLVSEQLKQCIHLDGASTVSNLQSNDIRFYPTGGDVGSETGYIIATNSVFSAGSVGKHIVYKTETGYEQGRFEILEYVSGTRVNVQVLQETSQNTYTDWYLTFSTISGLDQYTGTAVSVVADGGYDNDYFVEGSEIDLGRQVTHAVVGYKYSMFVKSFCLGVPARADNTQATMKTANQFGIRAVSTAGLKIGTSPYKLERVQDMANDDGNYFPPLPIDGTKYVTYSDNSAKDKFFYIVQDEPLPAVVTAVMLNADHALTQ